MLERGKWCRKEERIQVLIWRKERGRRRRGRKVRTEVIGIGLAGHQTDRSGAAGTDVFAYQ